MRETAVKMDGKGPLPVIGTVPFVLLLLLYVNTGKSDLFLAVGDNFLRELGLCDFCVLHVPSIMKRVWIV